MEKVKIIVKFYKMDKLTQYQTIVSDILSVLATRVPFNKPNQKKHLVINEKRDEFILVSFLSHWGVRSTNMITMF